MYFLTWQVLRQINASIIIDDDYGNLVPTVESGDPILCLLFGSYPWNRQDIGASTELELMGYDKRMASSAMSCRGARSARVLDCAGSRIGTK